MLFLLAIAAVMLQNKHPPHPSKRHFSFSFLGALGEGESAGVSVSDLGLAGLGSSLWVGLLFIPPYSAWTSGQPGARFSQRRSQEPKQTA